MTTSTLTDIALEFPLKAALAATISRVRSWFPQEPGCEHAELVFDDINDVYCRHCRKDFTD